MQDSALRLILTTLVGKYRSNLDVTQETKEIVAEHETLLSAVRIAFTEATLRDALWVLYPVLIDFCPAEALSFVKKSEDIDSNTMFVVRCVLSNFIAKAENVWPVDDIKWLDSLLIVTPLTEMLAIIRIDVGLSEVMKKGNLDRAAKFLVQFIVAHRAEHVRLSLFKRTLAMIRSQPDEILGKFLTSCLLSGIVPIMHMAYDAVNVLSLEMKLGATPDFDQIGKEQTALFVLAERAIGWMSINQDVCVRFVVRCMSRMSEEMLKRFDSDFYYLLCLNYPDLVKGELKALAAEQTKPYYKRIKRMHGQAAKFWRVKSKLGNCAELKPYASMQRDYREYYLKTMGESNAKAMNNLAFIKLFPVVRMLHGHGTVMYNVDKDGKLQRSTSDVKHHQATVTLPMMSCVGAHSFDARLNQLRLLGVPR
jgi:hypothetical protein